MFGRERVAKSLIFGGGAGNRTPVRGFAGRLRIFLSFTISGLQTLAVCFIYATPLLLFVAGQL